MSSQNSRMMWLNDEIVQNYPRLSSRAQRMLLPSPSSYLVECGFSAGTKLLTHKRGSLDISVRGVLGLKLTKLQRGGVNVAKVFSQGVNHSKKGLAIVSTKRRAHTNDEKQMLTKLNSEIMENCPRMSSRAQRTLRALNL